MTTPTSGAADLPEALHRVIDDFERRERGIPQAHIAAALVTELRAALAAGQATAAQAVVPAGWKLVPVDATDEMVRATDEVNFENGDTDGTIHNVWHVMIAAAPARPAAPQGAAYAALPDERAAFERWNKDANQGYDLAPCTSGKLQTFESTETEHAWRGFFHGLRASRGQAPAGAAQADSVPAVSDLPPLPAPDLRDVGTKPQEIKEFLKGYATEYARTTIAARARLLDSDLSNLTERGAKAWAGVDAQGLREGGASPSANAGEPSGHIKEPYTLAEIKAKIASNDYSAEMLLQHAMLLLDSASISANAGQAGEYPALVCDYCGALTPEPWHSSGMLHGKMSKHIHSCDACAPHGQAPAGAAQADSVPAVSDLPPLPAPDLRDVGTKPQEIKEFLKGYATEYARTTIAARAPADSVQEDAACWQWLAEYLVGTRTDIDDEIVACETVNDLRNLVESAIKQGEKQ